MINNIQLNIVANAQFQQVYAEVAKLKEAMLSLQKASVGGPFSQSQTAIIKSAQSAFDSAVLSTRAFTVEHVKMTDSIAKFGKELNAGKLSLSNYYKIWRDSAKGVSAELDALATNQARLNRSIAIADPLRPGYAKLVTDINGVVTAQEKQIFYQKALNTALQQGSMKLIDFGKNTQWMGRQLTVGLTMPLAMFGATASTVFLNVDKELTRMMKVYGTGLTQPTHEALMQIRSDVLGLGNDLAKSLGVSVQETAAMAADLAATGQTGSNLINATREALRLSTLGELDHQQAMQATISLQNVYKLSTQGLTEAVNFLNAVENQTSTSLQDLVDAIPRVGPIVQQLGGSFKDTAAMMVAMKEAGVPAAQSANAIKSAIASLINPTKNARDAFAAYHINLKSIASTTGGNPVKMIVALQEAMQKLDPLVKAQLIEKLFGKFQQARVQALIDNLNKAGSQTQTVFQLMGASTKDLADLAANELKTQTESASGRFKRMVETIKADLLPLGQSFLNSFSRLGFALDKIVKGFQTIGHVLGPIAGLLGKVFGTGLAGLIVIGPVIMLTGLFANLIGNILRGVNSLRMFKQGMDSATSGENKFMAGLHGMRNFYEDLDKSAIAARNQIELMPEAITTNAKAFETLRKAIFDLTIQFEALAAAQKAASMASPMAAEGAAASSILSQMRLPGFASGGRVPGVGNTDSVPAMLTPGESIVNKSATAKYGPVIDAMNKNMLPGFVLGETAVKSRSITDETVIKGWGNATMFLPEKMNQDLSKSGVSAAILSDQIAKQGASTYASLMTSMAREMGLKMKEFSPQFKEVATAFANQTTSILQEAAKSGVIVNDEWIATNVLPKLKETAATMQIAGKEVGVALDTVVNEIKTAGVKGIAGGGAGGEGRFAIPGLGSYKSLRTKAQSLAKEWDESGVFDYKSRYSETRKKIISEFKVLNTQSQEYQNAVMAHLGQGIDMTFGKMKEAVAKAGGNVSRFVHGFLLRFDTSYRQGIKEATQSNSPSRIGEEAGINMGQGVSKGVLNPANILAAEEAGIALGKAEVMGHNVGTTTFLGMPGMGVPNAEVDSMTKFGRLKNLATSPMGSMALMMGGTALLNQIPNKIGGADMTGARSILSAGASTAAMTAMFGPEVAIPATAAATALATFSEGMKNAAAATKQANDEISTSYQNAAKNINAVRGITEVANEHQITINQNKLTESLLNDKLASSQNKLITSTKGITSQYDSFIGKAGANLSRQIQAGQLLGGALGKSAGGSWGNVLKGIFMGGQYSVGGMQFNSGLADIFGLGGSRFGGKGTNYYQAQSQGQLLTQLTKAPTTYEQLVNPKYLSGFKEAYSTLGQVERATLSSNDAFKAFNDTVGKSDPVLAQLNNTLRAHKVAMQDIIAINQMASAGFFLSQNAILGAGTAAGMKTATSGFAQYQDAIKADTAAAQAEVTAAQKAADAAHAKAAAAASGDTSTAADKKAIKDNQEKIKVIEKEKAARDQLYNAQLRNIEAQQQEMNLESDIIRARGSGDLLAMAAAKRALDVQRTKDAMAKAKEAADNADQAKIDALQKKIDELQAKQSGPSVTISTAAEDAALAAAQKKLMEAQSGAGTKASAVKSDINIQLEKEYNDWLDKHKSLWEKIKNAISDAFGWVQKIWDKLTTPVGKWFSDMWDKVSGWAKNVWTWLGDIIDWLTPPIGEWFSKLWSGVKTVAGEAWGFIKEIFGKLAGTSVGKWFTDLWDKAKSAAGAVAGFIGDMFSKLSKPIAGWFGGVWDKLSSTISTIIDKAKEFASVIKGITGGPLGVITSLFGGVISKLVNAVVGKASGGYVSGPGSSTSDSIPAMLSNGEYVIQASSVSKYGRDFLDAINNKSYSIPSSRLGTYTAEALSDTISNATNYGGNTINVYPPQGADAQQVANMVIRQLDLVKQKQQTMRRVGNG